MAEIDKTLKVLAEKKVYVGYEKDIDRFIARQYSTDGTFYEVGSGDTALQAASDAIFYLTPKPQQK